MLATNALQKKITSKFLLTVYLLVLKEVVQKMQCNFVECLHPKLRNIISCFLYLIGSCLF